MKVSIHEPNTIYLAVWHQNKRTAVTGSCRKHDGGIVQNIAQLTGDDIWQTVAAALADVAQLKMRHILIFCNDKTFVQTWRYPVRLEPRAPDRMALYNPHQWQILRHLCAYQRWMVAHNENLKQARALWNEHALARKN